MKKNMKIYIWGTGKMATQYIGCNEIPNENLCGFIETKKSKNMINVIAQNGSMDERPKSIHRFLSRCERVCYWFNHDINGHRSCYRRRGIEPTPEKTKTKKTDKNAIIKTSESRFKSTTQRMSHRTGPSTDCKAT